MRQATEEGLRLAVRARRKELGLTQEEMAQKIERSLRTYVRWENGKDKGRPINRNLVRIAKALDTTPMALESEALLLSDPSTPRTREEAMENLLVDLRADFADLQARLLLVERRLEDDDTR